MRTTVIRALILEQAKRTYGLWILALAGALAIGYTAALNLGPWPVDPRQVTKLMQLDRVIIANYVRPAMAVLLGMYVLGTVLISDGSGEYPLGMPRFLLRLPVRTSTLVLTRYGFDLLSTSFLAFACVTLYRVLAGTPLIFAIPLWEFVLGATALSAYARTVAWCLSGMGLLVVALWGTFLYVVFAGSMSYLGWWPPADLGGFAVLTLLVAGAGLGVSLGAIALQRRGQLLTQDSLLQYRDKAAQPAKASGAPFASPAAALRWYEWRRQGHLHVSMVYIAFFALLLPYLIDEFRFNRFDIPPERLVFVLGDMVIAALKFGLVAGALIAGTFFMFQNSRTYLGTTRNFLFIRPVSTGSLAYARFAALARSTALTLVPLAILVGLTVGLDRGLHDYNYLYRWSHPNHGSPGFVVITLFFIAGFGLLWSILWVGNVAVAVLLVLSVAGVLGVPLLLADLRPDHVGELVLLLGGTLCVLACVRLTALAWQRGHLNRWNFGLLLLATPVLLLAYLALLNFDEICSGGRLRIAWNLQHIIPILIPLAIAPIVGVPLVMDWARHR